MYKLLTINQLYVGVLLLVPQVKISFVGFIRQNEKINQRCIIQKYIIVNFNLPMTHKINNCNELK